MLAITHVPSPAMESGERTYAGRDPIDAHLAAAQHLAYCRLLERCGAIVKTLDVNRHLPDCAFVEDAAVVLDEIAVLATMGAASRRAELPGIETELRKHREVLPLELPAKLEGGDVVRVGKTLLVGESTRTNRAGIAAPGIDRQPFWLPRGPDRSARLLALENGVLRPARRPATRERSLDRHRADQTIGANSGSRRTVGCKRCLHQSSTHYLSGPPKDR